MFLLNDVQYERSVNGNNNQGRTIEDRIESKMAVELIRSRDDECKLHKRHKIRLRIPGIHPDNIRPE